MKKNPNSNIPDLVLEKSLLDKGFSCIVGIDEVGRGSWAGPVYVGGYVYTPSIKQIVGVKDSKLLSPQNRERLYPEIAIKGNYKIGIGEVEMINKLGIGRTIKELIGEMIEKFKDLNAYFLIDGYFNYDFGKNTRQVIKGDIMHYSISAASICAKVERDRYMVQLATTYDKWCLEKNKGYGTANHIASLKTYGISPIHRTNYKPISKLIIHS